MNKYKLTQSVLIPLFSVMMAVIGIGFIVQQAPPSITKSFTVNGAGTVEVVTSGGRIGVVGSSGNEVLVKVYIKKQGKVLSPSDPIVRNIADGYDMDLSKSGNTITASAKRINRSRDWNRISISFEIEAPNNMSTDLKTSGGGISVSDVDGTHKINTSGGGISLKEVKGNTNARTSGGGISVSGMDGEIKLHTSGGGITISNTKGDIDAHTSGGGISVNNIEGIVDVSTSGGSINVNGSVSSLKAATSGGGIDVNLDNLTKSLYLKTSGGGVDATLPRNLGLDLDIDAQNVQVDLPGQFSGQVRKDRIEGTLNGGGIPVQIYATSRIDVDFQ